MEAANSSRWWSHDRPGWIIERERRVGIMKWRVAVVEVKRELAGYRDGHSMKMGWGRDCRTQDVISRGPRDRDYGSRSVYRSVRSGS